MEYNIARNFKISINTVEYLWDSMYVLFKNNYVDK